MAQTLKEQLLASARAAAKAAAGMRNAQSSEELHQHLRDYVYAKYLLDASDENDIDELTALSIARALKLDKDLMKEVDNAAECTGSTSAMRKKVDLQIVMNQLLIETDYYNCIRDYLEKE